MKLSSLFFFFGQCYLSSNLAGKKMSSSAIEPESPDLVCQLDNVQGIVDALTSVRWKRQQVPSLASFAAAKYS